MSRPSDDPAGDGTARLYSGEEWRAAALEEAAPKFTLLDLRSGMSA